MQAFNKRSCSVLSVSSTGGKQVGWAHPTAPGSLSTVSSPADLVKPPLPHLPPSKQQNTVHIGVLLKNDVAPSSVPLLATSLPSLDSQTPLAYLQVEKSRREGVLGAERGVAERQEKQGALWAERWEGTVGPVPF